MKPFEGYKVKNRQRPSAGSGFILIFLSFGWVYETNIVEIIALPSFHVMIKITYSTLTRRLDLESYDAISVFNESSKFFV